MIETEAFLYYVDVALDGMADTVRELGDELANRHLDLPDANSPYAILTHVLGVMEYWGGYIVAGRQIKRDRDAEFVADGPVASLLSRVEQSRFQLRSDVAQLVPGDPPRGMPDPEDAELPMGRTQGGALIHMYEEIAQHRGQMEVTRDVLRASWAHTVGPD